MPEDHLFTKLKRVIDLAVQGSKAPPPLVEIAPVKAAILSVAQWVEEIEIKTVPTYEGPILGEYKLYTRHKVPYDADGKHYAVVKVAGHLNTCWTRLVVVKEMCHCILDQPDTSRVSNAKDLMTLSRALVLKSELQAAALGTSVPFFNERFAINAALEILCPVAARRSFIDDYARGGIGALTLAEKFKIPQLYVPQHFDPGYTEMMSELFERNGAAVRP